MHCSEGFDQIQDVIFTWSMRHLVIHIQVYMLITVSRSLMVWQQMCVDPSTSDRRKEEHRLLAVSALTFFFLLDLKMMKVSVKLTWAARPDHKSTRIFHVDKLENWEAFFSLLLYVNYSYSWCFLREQMLTDGPWLVISIVSLLLRSLTVKCLTPLSLLLIVINIWSWTWANDLHLFVFLIHLRRWEQMFNIFSLTS